LADLSRNLPIITHISQFETILKVNFHINYINDNFVIGHRASCLPELNFKRIFAKLVKNNKVCYANVLLQRIMEITFLNTGEAISHPI